MTTLLDLTADHAAARSQIADGLRRVEVMIDQQLASDLPPVMALCGHVERYRGKMLRPTVSLLSGLAAAPECATATIRESNIIIAAVVEIIHLATLVHDDVLDDADLRRSGETINRVKGNEVAIILGDYLISNAFHLCSTLDSQEPSLLIGAVTNRVCEGELLQLHHRDDFELDEQTYFQIVERKTASLIGVVCELGAWCTDADEQTRRRFRSFGVKLGIAFQIRDDLLDITGDESVVGKSLGKDIEKGKLTLPLIHYLRACDPPARCKAVESLSGAEVVVAELAQKLRRSGSIAFALDRAQQLVHEAKEELRPLSHSPARALMLDLADAVLRREL